MNMYYGLRVNATAFKEWSKDKGSVVYKLTTDKGNTIGFLSSGRLAYGVGPGKLKNTVIVAAEETQERTFNSYYVAK